MPQKLLHARVDEALERAIVAEARRLGVTPSEVIRRALRAWVADEKTPPEPVVSDPIEDTAADTLNGDSVLADEKLNDSSVVARWWRRVCGARKERGKNHAPD
jgi:antitoxin component of RelBE/YafQ-DinJ toxin-antitoxin module